MVVIKASLDRLQSFSGLYAMFHLRNIRELACLFVTVCLLASRSLADDQEFMEDFLKREYTLVKPYRGKLTVSSRLAKKSN